MSVLKRLGRYLAAIVKLGRTEWIAKQALRTTDQLQSSVASHQREISSALDKVQRALDGDVQRALDALERSVDDIRRTQQVDEQLVVAGDAAVSRAIGDLGRDHVGQPAVHRASYPLPKQQDAPRRTKIELPSAEDD